MGGASDRQLTVNASSCGSANLDALIIDRVPLSRASIEKAIELNGTAVAKNLDAVRIGCHLASDPDLAKQLLAGRQGPTSPQSLAGASQHRGRANLPPTCGNYDISPFLKPNAQSNPVRPDPAHRQRQATRSASH
jgi:hypothetical protein